MEGDEGNMTYRFSVTPDHFRSAARPAGGMRFSSTETLHLLISIVVLTFAFALSFTDGIYYIQSLAGFALILAISFVAVSTGFVLHEIAHKKAAQGYGCFAEFRMNVLGLGIGLITALFAGILFALPGAVMIFGRITKRENGIISLAGPAVNLAIGFGCYGLYLLLGFSTFIGSVLLIIAFVNLWLAFFNLLPIPPLDGSKIFSWNIGIYVAVMAAASVGFALMFL